MKIADAISTIQKEQSVGLIGHIMPDGDTLGSCIALKHALEALGKSVEMYCQDEIPRGYQFLEGAQEFKRLGESIKQYDLVISLDCSDRERMGCCSIIMDKAGNSINIDHHISNTLYADMNIVDEKASATGELVYELIVKLGVKPNKIIADALYTAISTDTGSFCYSSTTPATHRIIATLIEYGAEVDRLSTLLFKQHSLTWVKLLSKALATLEMDFSGKVATIKISKDMMNEVKAEEDEASGIINYAKEIEGVELAVLLKEIDNNKVKVGLRSQSFIDVSNLAQQFGGGGHMRAAGFSTDGSLDEVRSILMKAVEGLFKESKWA